MKRISERIGYIEATNDPLSADIGFIDSESGRWLYDVGNDEHSIRSLSGQYHVVLSHFHRDHVGNLDKIQVKKLYVSPFTYEHVGRGIVVENDLYIDDLHIFPLPSSHTKGCLGLEVAQRYAFIGDASYSKANAEYYIYNAQLLKEEIEVLKRLRAETLLVSHRKGLAMPKAAVIEELERIYAGRDKYSAEIYVKREK